MGMFQNIYLDAGVRLETFKGKISIAQLKLVQYTWSKILFSDKGAHNIERLISLHKQAKKCDNSVTSRTGMATIEINQQKKIVNIEEGQECSRKAFVTNKYDAVNKTCRVQHKGLKICIWKNLFKN